MASALAGDLPELRRELINSINIVSQKENPCLLDYEVALKNTIEDFYPDRYWWEVTKCEIHEELHKPYGLLKIIEKIMSKITLCD